MLGLGFGFGLAPGLGLRVVLGLGWGLGFGLGYLGTIPVLLIVLYFFILSDTVLFDLNKQEFENIRFTALIVALWFLLFAIPMLFFFKDKTSKDIQTNKKII